MKIATTGRASKAFGHVLAVAIIVLALQPRLIWASSHEAHEYLMTMGAVSKKVLWYLYKTDKTNKSDESDNSPPFKLFYKENEELTITQTDARSATRCWESFDTANQTEIHAERRGNVITLEGQLNGKAIQQQANIDKAPWFQATSWSLRRFVLSGEKDMDFWTLRPDNLKAYKVVARREAEEILELKSGPVKAVRILLQLKGMLAPFWKSHYWFRKQDGVFLRFEGPGGPPGTPKLTVEYQNPITSSDLAEVRKLKHRAADNRHHLQDCMRQ